MRLDWLHRRVREILEARLGIEVEEPGEIVADDGAAGTCSCPALPPGDPDLRGCAHCGRSRRRTH